MRRDPELLEMRRTDSVTRSFPLFSLRIFVSTESTLPREVPGGEIQGSDCVPWERTVTCVTLASVPGSVLGSYSRSRGRRRELEAVSLGQSPHGVPGGQDLRLLLQHS